MQEKPTLEKPASRHFGIAQENPTLCHFGIVQENSTLCHFGIVPRDALCQNGMAT